jgi:KDO2-lipid IV(A) lauroyltransferase
MATFFAIWERSPMVSNLDNRRPARPQNTTGHDDKRFTAKLSQKHIITLGKVIGSIAYFLDVPHRRIVRRNLKFTHPEWSRNQIEKISKRVFQNLSITFVEICQLATFSRQDVLNNVRIEGLDKLTRALQSNKGLVIVSAHLGNWEMGLQYTCCLLQKPILGVAKKIRFAPLNRWFHLLRTRFGIKIIYKKGSLPEMRQTLRRGGALGLLVDQSRRSEGVDVTFFGHKVTATPAAAFLAIRCQSIVLPIFCIRKADNRLTIEVKSPLEIKRTGDLRSDLRINTQIITDEVEKAVRQYPDQWFWVHKRWKKYYPYLYPEYQARKKRSQKRRRRHNQT